MGNRLVVKKISNINVFDIESKSLAVFFLSFFLVLNWFWFDPPRVEIFRERERVREFV